MTTETKIELTIGILIVVIVSLILSLKSANRHPTGSTGEREAVLVAEPETTAGSAETKAPGPRDTKLVIANSETPKKPEKPEPPKPVPPPKPKPEPALKAEASPKTQPVGKQDSDWRKQYEAGKALLEQEELFQARPVLTKALMSAPEGKERTAVRDLLDRVNKHLIFSPMPTPDSVMHVVKPGDSFWLLQQKYNVTVGVMKWANHKRRDILRAGERLKILNGKWSGLVQKNRFRLIVFYNGDYVREYTIGIGKFNKTPAGDFQIKLKEKNPTWYSPEGVFPFGHPKNILGTRWLAFKDTEEFQGYGIHGCPNGSGVGEKSSNGCIRMYNKDVEEVYEMLRKGDQVTIVK